MTVSREVFFGSPVFGDHVRPPRRSPKLRLTSWVHCPSGVTTSSTISPPLDFSSGPATLGAGGMPFALK